MAHFLLLFVGYSLLGALSGAAVGGAFILLAKFIQNRT